MKSFQIEKLTNRQHFTMFYSKIIKIDRLFVFSVKQMKNKSQDYRLRSSKAIIKME